MSSDKFITLEQLTRTTKGLVNKINAESTVIDGKIGTLSSLTTTAKSSLVAAINEVAANGGGSGGGTTGTISYNDLTDKPTIPVITDTYSSSSSDGMSGIAVNSAITTALGNINSFDVEIVSSTSSVSTPNNHTIYFVPQTGNASVHDEYMYINNNWELIGTTAVDLSGYLQDSDIAAWAKASTKPTYTASEVGALPDTTIIPAAQVQSDWNATTGMGVILNKPTIPTVPTTVSSFTNDSGYLTLADLPIYDGTVQNG